MLDLRPVLIFATFSKTFWLRNVPHYIYDNMVDCIDKSTSTLICCQCVVTFCFITPYFTITKSTELSVLENSNFLTFLY